MLCPFFFGKEKTVMKSLLCTKLKDNFFYSLDEFTKFLIVYQNQFLNPLNDKDDFLEYYFIDELIEYVNQHYKNTDIFRIDELDLIRDIKVYLTRECSALWITSELKDIFFFYHPKKEDVLSILEEFCEKYISVEDMEFF